MSRDRPHDGYQVGNAERRERGHPDGWRFDHEDPSADTQADYRPRRGEPPASGEHDQAEKDG